MMGERDQTTNAAGALKGIQLLFIAILMGILFLLFIAIVVNQITGGLVSSLNEYRFELKIGLAILSFACMLAAKKVFNQSIRIAKDSLNQLAAKLNQFKFALIKYLALCEFPALLAIVFFLLTGDFAFLIYAAVLLGFIIVVRPTRQQVSELLQLDDMERAELENKKI